LRAKHSVGLSNGSKDTVKSWTLFGDPSMKLPESAFTGVVTATEISTDTGGGCARVSGQSGGPFQSNLILELLLLFSLFFAIRRFRHQPSLTISGPYSRG